MLTDENISNEFIYSGSTNQSKVATNWSGGTLRVLISTTIGLVGNESASTQLVCIVGILYDIPSIVQAIGRIRPRRRNDDSMMKIFISKNVKSKLYLGKVECNSHFKQLLSSRVISKYKKTIYMKCMTVDSVHEWMMRDIGCRLVSLASRMGYDQTRCKICDNCRTSPAAKSAKLKQIEVTKFQNNKRMGNMVIDKLKQLCLCCKNKSCDGTCVLRSQPGIHCYHCLSRHMAKKCPGNWKKVLETKACYSCFRYRVDDDNHDYRDCSRKGEIQERLRGLIHHEYLEEKKKIIINLSLNILQEFMHQKKLISDICKDSKILCEFCSVKVK